MPMIGPDTSSIAFSVAVARVHAVFEVVHHRLDDDDGVVHDDADGEHQAEHRERVDREAEDREEDERAEQRDRDGEQRNERRSHVLEEHEDDDHDEHDGFEQRLDDLFDRGFDRRRRVVDDLVVHVGREEPLQLLERGVDALGRLQLVGAGQQVDRQHAGGLAVEPSERLVVLRAELDAADVADADLASLVGGAHDDVAELVRR